MNTAFGFQYYLLNLSIQIIETTSRELLGKWCIIEKEAGRIYHYPKQFV